MSVQVIKIPRRITKAFIKNAPYYFIYSSSVHKEIAAGQAEIGMGNKKCFRCPVRWSQCRSSGYFNDNQLIDIKIEIEVALDKIPKDGTPIIPFPKIGEGFSNMKWFAPKSYEYLMAAIDKIKYPNIEYVS